MFKEVARVILLCSAAGILAAGQNRCEGLHAHQWRSVWRYRVNRNNVEPRGGWRLCGECKGQDKKGERAWAERTESHQKASLPASIR